MLNPTDVNDEGNNTKTRPLSSFTPPSSSVQARHPPRPPGGGTRPGGPSHSSYLGANEDGGLLQLLDVFLEPLELCLHLLLPA